MERPVRDTRLYNRMFLIAFLSINFSELKTSVIMMAGIKNMEVARVSEASKRPVMISVRLSFFKPTRNRALKRKKKDSE